jgi:hypothetical protein
MRALLLVLALLGSVAMADYRDAIDDVEWYTADEPGHTLLVVYYVDGTKDKMLMKESEVGTPAMYTAIEKMATSRNHGTKN